MRRIGTAAVAAAFAALSIVMLPAPAGACSCALGDPRDAVDGSDAAFVGTLVERTDPQPRNGVVSSAQNVVWTFEVESLVKGPLGSTVDVHSPWSGASCGLEVGEGKRTGLLLTRADGEWTSSLCLQIEPDVLLRAAQPLPAPDATGPPVFFVAGTMGEARIVGLDLAGRTAAYGFGRGYAVGLAACPGDARLVEVAVEDEAHDTTTLVVREAATLQLVREVALGRAVPNLRETSCAARDGGVVYLWTGGGRNSAIVAVHGDRVSRPVVGPASGVSFEGHAAYITESTGSGARRIVRVDLQTREHEVLAVVEGMNGAVVPSPDGTRLAGVVYRPPLNPSSPPSEVVLVDLRWNPPLVRRADLSRPNVTGDVVWFGDDQFAFFPDGDGDEDRVRFYSYDGRLRQVASFDGWAADDVTLVGGNAYGLAYDHVQGLDVTDGSVDAVRRFDGTFYAFAGLTRVPSRPSAPRAVPTSNRTPWLVVGVVALVLASLLVGARAIRARATRDADA